jgi:hypothetical protein
LPPLITMARGEQLYIYKGNGWLCVKYRIDEQGCPTAALKPNKRWRLVDKCFRLAAGKYSGKRFRCDLIREKKRCDMRQS